MTSAECHSGEPRMGVEESETNQYFHQFIFMATDSSAAVAASE
jgi:hypothetical protein